MTAEKGTGARRTRGFVAGALLLSAVGWAATDHLNDTTSTSPLPEQRGAWTTADCTRDPLLCDDPLQDPVDPLAESCEELARRVERERVARALENPTGVPDFPASVHVCLRAAP
ncbi:hypothetical protein [Streptomyces sp. NPDC049906]|uniref:hypothetical protein n=1 Tax=Streptomyces sp. NPDC049906 TaxID=3155656 RepID=UPI00343D259C